jgi:phosphatidate cytidylyltransferase
MINKVDLGKRLIFAAWGIPVGWWLVNSTMSLTPRSFCTVLPGEVTAVLLIIMACYEYGKMLSISFSRNGFWLSYIWIAVFLGLELIGQNMPMKFAIFILLIFVGVEAVFWGEKNQGKWKRASLLFSGMVFFYIAGSSLLNLYQEPFQSFFIHYRMPMFSQMGVVTVILSVFMCDSGAYFAGSLFGKHKYSTISPNKTVEGSVGGFLCSLISCMLCWHYMGNHSSYPYYIGILMGLVIGISAQAGDLLISIIKRYFKVKDASALIPGHGGILDRFGSVFFTAPMLGLILWIVNKIA